MAADSNVRSDAQQQANGHATATNATAAAQTQRSSLNIRQRLLSCLHSLSVRHIRNENLFVMSLVQALCAVAMLILSVVLASRSNEASGYSMFASLASCGIIILAACHGIATSRHKRYCTVLALFVLCQASCLASLILLACSAVGLHSYILESQRRISESNAVSNVSELIISLLLSLFSLMEFCVALSCCMACGRQLRPKDSRISLDPHGNGLIVIDNRVSNLAVVNSRFNAVLPPPFAPPPPPAYSTMDQRRWRRHRQRPVSAEPDFAAAAPVEQQQQQQQQLALPADVILSLSSVGNDQNREESSNQTNSNLAF